MTDWLQPLLDRAARGEACVLVTVAATRGSTPREPGARMVVTRTDSFGTIGGGRLEHRSVELARELLSAGRGRRLERFALGPSLGQCCGGVAQVELACIRGVPDWLGRLRELVRLQQPAVLVGVNEPGIADKLVVTAEAVHGAFPDPGLTAAATAAARRLLSAGSGPEARRVTRGGGSEVEVLMEPVRPPDLQIVLFGAGHVGRALVQVMSGLPCRIRWVDNRIDAFPSTPPLGVECVTAPSPANEVDAACAGSCFVVMTHSHPLDQAICERILKRGDFLYCGLIGSLAKRRKFEKRFRVRGVPERMLHRLTCPIGVPGITGKHPRQIAVAVAAELLQVYESRNQQSSARARDSVAGAG